ncbi:MAG: hypothetical protein A3B79_05030 [Deltaproteobacteria bacterium RIFCSPHIGHO2_02_FULL_50_15]|nr:MAG: hypothetical protein A3B79_05030 [Deltaproteobacteria bacterium RIFCSPHIGHO2_02_FULL_50_15]
MGFLSDYSGVLVGPVPTPARPLVPLWEEVPSSPSSPDYPALMREAFQVSGLTDPWSRDQLLVASAPPTLGDFVLAKLGAAVDNKATPLHANRTYFLGLSAEEALTEVTEPSLAQEIKGSTEEVVHNTRLVRGDYHRYVEALASRLPSHEASALRRYYGAQLQGFEERFARYVEALAHLQSIVEGEVVEGEVPGLRDQVRAALAEARRDFEPLPLARFFGAPPLRVSQGLIPRRPTMETVRMILDPARPREVPILDNLGELFRRSPGERALVGGRGVWTASPGAVDFLSNHGGLGDPGSLRERLASYAFVDHDPTTIDSALFKDVNRGGLLDYDTQLFGPDPVRRVGATLYPQESRLAALVRERVPSTGRVLDMGGGIALAGLEVSELFPDLQVAVNDLHDPLEVMEDHYPDLYHNDRLYHRLSSRVSFLVGDALSLDPQAQAPFDLVLSSNLSPVVVDPLRLLVTQYNLAAPGGWVVTTVTGHMHDATKDWDRSQGVMRRLVGDLRHQGIDVEATRDYRTLVMRRLDNRPMVLRAQRLGSDVENRSMRPGDHGDHPIMRYRSFYVPDEGQGRGEQWVGLAGERPRVRGPREVRGVGRCLVARGREALGRLRERGRNFRGMI